MHRLLFLLLLIPATTFALEWSSGPTKTDIVELYTSEGCSSCPPADRWLSSLKDRPGVFSEFIPMAFHVDYWDYIGWKDQFAKPAYSERQRQYVRKGHVSQPYTPGIVINGKEWRQWFRGQRRWDPSGEAAGNLSTTIENGTLTAQYSGQGAGQLHIAYLGMGITSKIKAGENRGKFLFHDFVVLDVLSVPGTQEWSVLLPPTPEAGQEKTAMAVWISPSDSPIILQSVGGYLE
ncbi:DUF1223 domain-containing protein [Marinobacter caseinilyticus]|uniref:DUF1223 domain-containing protein n=1 Tax=Marinobacter caseinilyticus TaxID=2692195 RepID=UPI001F40E403|nr:DUF1223 domain-containing protein [Marinobacter caseinilyticus]